jgi:hypothetical protein
MQIITHDYQGSSTHTQEPSRDKEKKLNEHVNNRTEDLGTEKMFGTQYSEDPIIGQPKNKQHAFKHM